jgi:hypothetical protein
MIREMPIDFTNIGCFQKTHAMAQVFIQGLRVMMLLFQEVKRSKIYDSSNLVYTYIANMFLAILYTILELLFVCRFQKITVSDTDSWY